MPEHEAAPSPAGMLGRMHGGNSGSRTILLLEQASLRDICYFLSLSCFPEEAVLAFITSLRSLAWRTEGLREPRRWECLQKIRSLPRRAIQPPVLQHSSPCSDVNEVLPAAKPAPLQRLPGSQLKGLSPRASAAP